MDLSRVGVFDSVPAIGAGDALSYWNDPAAEPGDSAIDGDTKNAVFLAPEDGIFYLWRSIEWDAPQNLPVFSGSGIKTGELYGYSSHTYGWIGALVTRPDDPKQGRVYLFCHLGNRDEGAPQTNFPYTGQYGAATGSMLGTPGDTLQPISGIEASEITDASFIRVEAGDRLGYIGNVGVVSTGAHIHLEVYETFLDGDGNTIWQRVDPLSCFDESLFMQKYNEETDGPVITRNTYGWWSRIVGDWASFDTVRDNYEIVNGDPEIVTSDAWINTYVSAPGSPWLPISDSYPSAHSWIYFHDKLEEQIPLSGKDITVTDIFKEDRWDIQRFFEE